MRDLYAWPGLDLVRQGHATLQVTFAISGTIHVRAMSFFCFDGFSGRAIQWHYQWPCTNNAWPWSSRSPRPYRWPLLSQALYMLERCIFLVSTVFRVSEVRWNNNQMRDLLQIYLVPWYHGTNVPIGYPPKHRINLRHDRLQKRRLLPFWVWQTPEMELSWKVVKLRDNWKAHLSYGIEVAKTDGDNIRTLAHTDILQTKDLWIHYFENVGMQRFEL